MSSLADQLEEECALSADRKGGTKLATHEPAQSAPPLEVRHPGLNESHPDLAENHPGVVENHPGVVENHPGVVERYLGLVEYESTWHAMQRFTDERTADTPDEIWFLEHPPVFTLGMNGKREHILNPGDIPIVQVDRGGQVTYHGPGQLVVYPLIDLRRAKLGIRDLVTALERSVIDYAAELGATAECRRNAPGVYVEGRKLASVGIRVRRNGSYHGLALNVSLDLEPFSRINPCGYAGLQMTRLVDLGGPASIEQAANGLRPCVLRALGFRDRI
jgi:lipoyl(octanoyl) transferase